MAALIYYVSNARYSSRILKPLNVLTHLFDFNEMIPVIKEDGDDK